MTKKSKFSPISPNNSLNNLTGKEWIFNTNSIESIFSSEEERDLNRFLVELIETRFSTKGNESYGFSLRKIHPTPKPPQLMERLINFFSKKDELVFDPFCGVGGTLIGASLSNRKAIGIDLNNEYLDVYKKVCKTLNIKTQKVYNFDSNNLNEIKSLKNVEFDLILTDPPFGNMMTRQKTGESKRKNSKSDPTPFSNFSNDIGNLHLDEYLIKLKEILTQSVSKLKNKRYLLVFIKDFQPKKEYHGMLHFDVMNIINQIDTIEYKGMKIWYDKSINLFPYGYPYAYVGNQLHQYILIFRKENNKQ
jgi:DNA modification methylase